MREVSYGLKCVWLCHSTGVVADNYVHRLVQNKSDGKLVEVSGMSVGSSSTSGCTLNRLVFYRLLVKRRLIQYNWR